MEKFDKQEQRKNKSNVIKTFPVPFPSREIQENNTITTYPGNVSKVQIIIQAFMFLYLGIFLVGSMFYLFFLDHP